MKLKAWTAVALGSARPTSVTTKEREPGRVILHVTAGDFTPETQNYNRVQRLMLSPADVDVLVLVRRDALLTLELPANVHVHRAMLPGRLGLYAAEIVLLLRARRWSISAVATPASFVGIIAWLCRRAGRYRWIADLWDVPHMRDSEHASAAGPRGALRRLAGRSKVSMFRRALPSADLVIASVSPAGLKRYQIRPERLRAVGNAILLDDLVERETGDRDDGSICFVSTLFLQDRGIDTLVTAMDLLERRGWDHVRVRLAGVVASGVRAAIEASPVASRIELLGQVSHEEARRLMRKSEIGLLPYGANDDLSYRQPIKLFEYMASGCVVVASDLQGIREVVRHDSEALLVRPGDAAELAHAIERVLSDAELRERLRANAKQRVRAFDARRKARVVYEEIGRVCAGPTDARAAAPASPSGQGAH